jgi:ribosome-binding factor A
MFRNDQPSRKTLQLCAQVAETLSMILAEMPDDILRDLMVEEVQPAPDSSQLLVLLRPAPSAVNFDPVQAQAHLAEVSRDIRMEVAAAINRRRVPTLLYQVLSVGSQRR